MPKLDLPEAGKSLALGAGAVLATHYVVPMVANIPILGITLWDTLKIGTFVLAGVGVFVAKLVLERF